mmetsp:Transcript_35540/g.85747  ORF Transcript_35540/g.85747 Transcript_35540/m.85747 type:complete len:229 (-) Transcript_35540:3267-3953(-)
MSLSSIRLPLKSMYDTVVLESRVPRRYSHPSDVISLSLKNISLMHVLSTRANERAAAKLSSIPLLQSDTFFTIELRARASNNSSISCIAASSLLSSKTSVRVGSLDLMLRSTSDRGISFSSGKRSSTCACRCDTIASNSSIRCASIKLPRRSMWVMVMFESRVPRRYSHPSEVMALSLNEICVMLALSTRANESAASNVSSIPVLSNDNFVTHSFEAIASNKSSASGL